MLKFDFLPIFLKLEICVVVFFCLPKRDGESLNCKTRVRVTLFVGEAIF